MEQPFNVTEIREAIASGRASAVEICRAALDRIATTDGALNAFRAALQISTAEARPDAIASRTSVTLNGCSIRQAPVVL